MGDEPVTLATRGSALAMAQARSIADTIEAHRRSVELVEVTTTGDELDAELIHQLGTTGAFVRALDEEVLDESIDGAVHSMKDIPTEQPDELVIAAIPPRGPAEDVLVTVAGHTLEELEPHATVGTASLRRRAQLLRERPDLTVEPIRGNIDTRLATLYASALEAEDAVDGPTDIVERARERPVDVAYDALVLAAAGLERAGYADAVNAVKLDRAVPAPGQGALAVTTLDGEFAAWLNGVMDDPRTRVETTVERRILASLGAGCVAPLGVHAVIQGEHVQTRIQVLDRNGEEVIDVTRHIAVSDHVEEADTVASELHDLGAGDLIDEAKRDGPGPHHDP